MRLEHLPTSINDVWSSARAATSDLFTPSVRLGVTGLARSGKTVFIASLIRNLTHGGRLPFLQAHESGRLISAYLEPQPDDQIPRFDYETHIKSLEADPPQWPESTRRISQVRVALTYRPVDRFKRILSETRRLNVDIVDYPGEWLLDLEMLDTSYAAWSRTALKRADKHRETPAAIAFHGFLANLTAETAEDEQLAIEGAELFTAYLTSLRETEATLTVGPGRFLMPGDLAGSPLLTFFPMQLAANEEPARGSLAALLQSRYESYLTHVARPFFKDHFSRLDRQIVLIDLLTALNGGPNAIANLEDSLTSVLQTFRTGMPTWLSALLGSRRIDRLVFAATKADHIHHTSHTQLEAILAHLTKKASTQAEATGVDIKTLALSALRATREADAKDGNDSLPCIVGVPLPGETLAGQTFDGVREAALFPGDLPTDPEAALQSGLDTDITFPRFRPRRLEPPAPNGTPTPAPHIRMDKALEFLVGDYLT